MMRSPAALVVDGNRTRRSVNGQVDGVGHDARGAHASHHRYQVLGRSLVDHDLHGAVVGVQQRRNRRGLFARELSAELGNRRGRQVHLQTHLFLAVDGALQEQSQVLDPGALDRVLPRVLVGDQAGGGLEDRRDFAELVGAEGAAGLGDVDDGADAGERRLDLRRAPRVLDLDAVDCLLYTSPSPRD